MVEIEEDVKIFLKRILDDKSRDQKEKFVLLNKLFTAMFVNKKVPGKFKNYSSLILALLTHLDENFPIDKFSRYLSANDSVSREPIKKILKNEIF